MIHIGKRTTLQTLCGKSVARRWWVEAKHTKVGHIGSLTVVERVEPYGVTCKKCLKQSAPTEAQKEQR